MKKLLAAAAILSIAALAGCSANNNNNSADSSSEAVSETSSASSESTSDTTSESETAPAESGTNEDSPEENKPDSRAALYADAVLGAAQWPDMELITEDTAESAYSFTGIDLSLCEDYYFALPYTSVDLARIIIVKPAEGNENAVRSQVEAHFDYIKTSAADYPTQEAAVSGSVSGVTSDGYYYIIVSENGAAAADAIAAMEV